MDTALAAYLVKPDQRSFDLADLVVRHLGRELKAEEQAGGQGVLDMSWDGTEDQVVGQDAMVRARAVLDLSGPLGEQLEATGGTELLRDIELPLVDILATMERTASRRPDALSAESRSTPGPLAAGRHDASRESITSVRPQLQTCLRTLGCQDPTDQTGYTPSPMR